MILNVVLPIPLRKTFDYLLTDEQFAHATKEGHEILGRRVLISFGFRSAVGVVVGLQKEEGVSERKLKPITKFLDDEPLLDDQLLKLADWLSKRYLSSLGEAVFLLLPQGKNKEKALVSAQESNDFQDHPQISGESPYALTSDQTKAIETLHDALHAETPAKFLLYGVAAAGKTEVFMAAMKDVLSQGKTVLYLVPEIGLAEQSFQILSERFGRDQVVLWHSDMSPKNRLDTWWKIKRGEYQVVVGPRSACLAPLPHCGLFIVDEEHDPAFKEDRKPRFHVRDVMMKRAEISNANLIFGSATPSMEIFQESKNGNLKLLELTHRATRASTPHAQLLDMRSGKKKGGLAVSLFDAISTRAKKQEQTILFLNKRGFHRFLKCSKCDWVARCPKCDIALVEHKGEKHKSAEKVKGAVSEKGFICHYCHFFQERFSKCGQCGHKELFAGGFGTQRVVEELQKEAPWLKVLRWDRDAASHRGDNKKLFEAFSRGDYDVLVGTQMVSQGFNFPRVTLVGILEADAPLYFPDFRAGERAFQHIAQVAGRAGRAMVTGEVLIQTRHPDHYSMVKAMNFDFPGFAEEELKHRDDLNYPPFSHLIQVTTTSIKKDQPEKDINALIDKVQQWEFPVGILGPQKARFRKGQKGTPFQVLLKVPSAHFDAFLTFFTEVLSAKTAPFSVVVDPE